MFIPCSSQVQLKTFTGSSLKVLWQLDYALLETKAIVICDSRLCSESVQLQSGVFIVYNHKEMTPVIESSTHMCIMETASTR